MYLGAVVAQARFAVARQKEGAVEIDPIGALSQKYGGGHGKRGRHHAADHDLQPALARLRSQRQRLGEAAGLVELHVDGIVAASEGLQAGPVVQGLVGAYGDRTWTGKRCVSAGRQWL